MNSFRRGRWPVIAVFFVVAAIIVGSRLTTSTSGSGSGDSEDAAVRNAVLTALRVDMGKQMPAGQVPDVELSISDIDQHKSDATKAIESIFAGKALAGQKAGLDNIIESERSNRTSYRPLGAGVGTPTYKLVTINGDSAHVTGTVSIWTKSKILLADGAWHVNSPTNIIDFDMTLVKQDSAWLVDVYDWAFAPGGGP